MTKFTVIDGGGKGPATPGGPRGPDALAAQTAAHCLRITLIEILRGLARGNDPEGRIAFNLAAALEHMEKSGKSAQAFINEALAEMHTDIEPAYDGRFLDHGEGIVSDALRVAAERCARDNAAAGRAGQREHSLNATVRRYILARERQARSEGRSYVGDLTESLGPPPKPRRR